MDSPNAMQNSSTVMDVSIGLGVKPSRPDRWPSWKIQATTPSVADSDSALSTSARIGCTMLPVNRNSSTNVVIAISAMAAGRCEPMDALLSTSCASAPPTSVVIPTGVAVARTACTSVSAAADLSGTVVTTCGRSPCGLVRLLAAGDAGDCVPEVYVPSADCTAATPGSRDRLAA